MPFFGEVFKESGSYQSKASSSQGVEMKKVLLEGGGLGLAHSRIRIPQVHSGSWRRCRWEQS